MVRFAGMGRGIAMSLVVALVTLFLAGCATPQKLLQPGPEPPMEWALAEGGRVVWVKNIERFQDLGSAGFWHRVREFFTGNDTRKIARPYGVLHDRKGRLYLADPGLGVVHCLDTVRGTYFILGGGNNSPLVTPIGLAVDDNGRLYITDSATGTVFRYDPEQRIMKPFLEKKISRPTGIAFNPRNRLLYIADTLESCLVAVDQDGNVRKRIGGPGTDTAQFNRPVDIAVDGVGQIYVTDSLNFRITVVTPEGQVVQQFGDAGDARGYFSRPKGIAVDRAGHIYVCDALRDAIQVFDREGTPLLMMGRSGNGRGRFAMPSGLYIDSEGYIFVADTYNKRVQVFRFVPEEDNHDEQSPSETGRPSS